MDYQKNIFSLKKTGSDIRFDVFKGYGASILITGYNKKKLREIGIEFCAQSSLPFGKSEAGIHTFLPPEKTPDHRWGVVCSVWVQKNPEDEESSVKSLRKFLNERICTSLFPKLGISVYSWTPNPTHFYETESELGDFGDGYNTIEKEFGRLLLSIPMTGGPFRIEKRIGIRQGFMGVGLFLFFKTVKSAVENDLKISEYLFKFLNVVQIYGFIASGSKLGANNINKKNLIISTNEIYCPTLKERIGIKSKVPDGVDCIVELVLNAFSVNDLKVALKPLIKYLKKKR
ncbi:MAG: hypothetical protein ACTSVK_02595, partial [Promethearchaeota archaeon]